MPATARIVPFSEARARLSELLDEVEQLHEHVVVTRNGRPTAVVLSAEEYDTLEETVEILSDPEALEVLREAEEDVRAGRVRPWEDVGRELGLG
jgi:prevent-host-death family protein